MTQQLKYKTPIPIKAQKGTKVKYVSPRALRAKLSNARNKAISEQYFNQSPSILNLVKGAYYWLKSQPALLGEDESDVITGTAPAVGAAIGRIPLAISKTKLILPSVAAVASFIGGKSGAREIPSALGISRTKSVPYYRAEAALDSTQTMLSDTIRVLLPTENSNTSNSENEPKNESKVLRLRNKLAEVIKGKNTTLTNNNSSPNQENSWRKNIGKAFWETLGNNFGPTYKWRNLARTGMYLYKGPEVAGYTMQALPKYLEYAKTLFKEGSSKALDRTTEAPADTTKKTNKVDVPKVDTSRVAPIQRPVTTSTLELLDSINTLWGEKL